MSDDDDTPVQRPPRRPSSTSMLIWNNIDAWLTLREGRHITWTGGGTFRVVDENIGEAIVKVAQDEEPFVAIYRRGVQKLVLQAGGE